MNQRIKIDPQWWEMNKRDILVGVRMNDEERLIIESRPPDWIWDDSFPQKSGQPYTEERTYHSIFSSWVEHERVQPMAIRRFYLWEKEQIGFSITVSVLAHRSRIWPIPQ